MTSPTLSEGWVPADTALRARLAALSRAATTLGSDMTAGTRKRRKERYADEARANFAAAYAAKQARDPSYVLSEREQEREIERMRQALLQRQMLLLADKSRWSRSVDAAERQRTRERRRARRAKRLDQAQQAQQAQKNHVSLGRTDVAQTDAYLTIQA